MQCVFYFQPADAALQYWLKRDSLPGFELLPGERAKIMWVYRPFSLEGPGSTSVAWVYCYKTYRAVDKEYKPREKVSQDPNSASNGQCMSAEPMSIHSRAVCTTHRKKTISFFDCFKPYSRTKKYLVI